MQISELLQRTRPKLTIAFATGVLIAFSTVVLPAGAQAQTVVRDNSSNSIIRGGTVTKEEFIAKAEANNPNDLQAIYSAYGLNPDQYASFHQNAKMGVAYKNGDIVVAGRVVARNTYSLGRDQKPYATVRTINGKQYYESRSQDVFASQSIPVIVLLDDQGRFVMGVLTACGNPIRGSATAPHPTPQPAPAPTPQPTPAPVTPVEKPITPAYRCENLRAVRRTGGSDTQYTVIARASHTNARVSYVDFDFGDGTTAPGVRPPARTVGATTTTYPSASGSTTTSGTTYNTNAGANNGTTTYDYSTGTYYSTGSSGTTSTGTTNTNTGNTYTGATTGRTEVSTDHDFPQPGTYTVRATVYFTDDSGNTGALYSQTCTIQVAVQRPVTPVAPVATPPAAPPAAPILPATGVGEFAALFTAVSVLGSAGYYIYTKRRLAGL